MRLAVAVLAGLVTGFGAGAPMAAPHGTIAEIPAVQPRLEAAPATAPWRLAEIISTTDAMRAERRTALVIGNSTYPRIGRLKNPVNDSRAMAQVLNQLGFDVIALEDLGQKGMKRAIRDFGKRLGLGGVGLFYYSGHGVQIDGVNYLMPIDAPIEFEDDVEIEAVAVDTVLAKMASARNRLNIVILDSCRNNPFQRKFRSATRGLARVDAPTGTLVAYAAAPGGVAIDGDGVNGLYTGELLKAIQKPGLKIEEVFKRVRVAVRDESRDKQVPWESSSLTGDFYFRLDALPALPAEPPIAAAPSGDSAAALEQETVFWQSIRGSDNPASFKAYLDAYPSGRFTMLANIRLEELSVATPESQGIDPDVLFWEAIKTSANRADYQAYLRQFPDGNFTALARSRLKAIERSAAAKADAKRRAAAEAEAERRAAETAEAERLAAAEKAEAERLAAEQAERAQTTVAALTPQDAAPAAVEPPPVTGRKIGPASAWSGKVVFSKNKDGQLTKGYRDLYRCDIRVVLSDYTFDTPFRCADVRFRLRGSVRSDGVITAAQATARNGAAYDLGGTIWRSEAFNQGQTWRLILTLNESTEADRLSRQVEGGQ